MWLQCVRPTVVIIGMYSDTDTVAAIQIAQALEDLRIFYMKSLLIP